MAELLSRPPLAPRLLGSPPWAWQLIPVAHLWEEGRPQLPCAQVQLSRLAGRVGIIPARVVPKIEYKAIAATTTNSMSTAAANLGLTILYYTVNSDCAASAAHSSGVLMLLKESRLGSYPFISASGK